MHCSIALPAIGFALRWPRGLVILVLIGLLLHASGLVQSPPAHAWWVSAISSVRGRKPSRRWRARRRGRLCQQTRRRYAAWLSRGLWRSALLAGLLLCSGWAARTPGSWLLLLLPLLHTLSLSLNDAAPLWSQRLRWQPWSARLQRLYQLTLVLLLCLSLLQLAHSAGLWWLLTLTLAAEESPRLHVDALDAQTYRVQLRGRFELLWQPRDAFECWLLILFLRRLCPADSPSPCWSQAQLAQCFATSQHAVSRWESQVKQHGWHFLSDRFRHQLHSSLPEAELSRAILDLWVPAFWLSAWDVRERLITLGLIADRNALAVEALQRLAQHTGFAQVRERLLERFNLPDGQPLAKEQWWLRQLLALNERLLQQLERGERLSPQQLIACEPLRLNTPAKQASTAPERARLHTALFDPPAASPAEAPRCTYCDSPDVSRKSAQPRLKRLSEPSGVERCLEVFRYYCHNSACAVQSFTHFPAGVRPHSAYALPVRLLALELYLNLLSTYRRSARLLGVKASTVYHWLADLSPAALQLAAYLGVVRSSGVLGLDDKWIKVCSPAAIPKHGTQPRAVWRYAYFAVDVYSLDLLALELYPEHNDHALRLFLLELKARGLQPHVIVSDLDPAYARLLPAVFPSAIHHECIFHALQNAQRQLTQVYGKHYRESMPAAATLQAHVVQLFRARTQKTVRQRFAALLALREAYVLQTPQVASVFDSLETHFPKLVNAIESPTIPRTNNTTELVIRRFDQHYQGMCGFDSSESAQVYLRLFALVYRLTPFATDNPNQAIRGRCPLDLAGYDLTALPLAQFFSQRPRPSAPPQAPELVPMQ
jgi:hypothetical protein